MSGAVNLKIVLGFAIIYTVWGSTYLAIRLGVDTIPAFLLVGVRFLIGGVLFYAWSRFRGASNPKRVHILPMALVGLLLIVGGNGFVTWAEEVVPSGLTALLIALVPFWIVLADWLRPGGQRPVLAVAIGLAIGFVGVGALINPTNIGGLAEISQFGALILVVATMLWATGSIYSRQANAPESQTMAVSMQMFFGGLVLMVISYFRGELETFVLADVTTSSALSFVYLTTIGSFAFAVYMWLLKAIEPAKVATYAYVNPVIALILGNVIADEFISAWTIGCSVVILVGVLVIVRSKSKAPLATTEELASRLAPDSRTGLADDSLTSRPDKVRQACE